MKTLLLCMVFTFKLSTCTDPAIEEEELAAHIFMAHVNYANSVREHKNIVATWNYDVNVTEENLKQKVQRMFSMQVCRSLVKYSLKLYL